MSIKDLREKVLEHIQVYGPIKAKDIADALGVERPTINKILYGALRTQVHQSNDYRWALLTASSPANRASAQSNSYANLFDYYLDCLSQDDNSGVQTFADSKFDLDYAELEAWPLDDTQSESNNETARRLFSKQRRDARKKVLWLGYPVLVRHARSRKGWEGAFIEPLIIWPQDSDSGHLTFLPEPLLNTRALQSLLTSENVFEEAAQLSDELGLDTSELPPLEEIVARLRGLRPEWSWKEELAPAPFRKAGALRTIKETGIYNSAVIVLADRSPFTMGLERELSELRTVTDSAVSNSSLGTILGSFRLQKFNRRASA